jgi:arylsulfatase A-like enzyme
VSDTPIPPRNVLLITTDQERYFAEDPVPLPARQRLRGIGTTFDHFYGSSVACSPARSVIYTGQHAPTTGVIDNVDLPAQADLAVELDTIGDRLRSCGYYTAYKGKWHLSLGARAESPSDALDRALEPYGFADYSLRGDDLGGPYEGFELDDLIAAEATQWLKATGTHLVREGRPWFLAVNFVNPHDIMFCTNDASAAANPMLARLGRRSYAGPPLSERYAASWDLPFEPARRDALTAPDRPAAHQEFLLAMSPFLGVAPAANDHELRIFRDYYLNCIRDVDVAMHALLDSVEQLGLLENTAIVFSSDHGELAGAHGLFGKGPCAYDENLRLPLIVVDPDAPGGRRCPAIASQIDLVPTILGLAGVPDGAPAGKGLPGRDLTALVRANGDAWAPEAPRQAALFAYSGLGFIDGVWSKAFFDSLGGGSAPPRERDFSKRGLMRTLITGRYKFSRYFAPGEHHAPRSFDELCDRNTLELFDRESDPEERTNLAFDPAPDTRPLVEHLNADLQRLIDDEIGEDDGRTLPALPGAPWVA